MYHNKKKMAMGGMNMPRVMKKEMPGGGMVSPMEMGMGGKMDYGMGGKMEMGHGGDMARAIKIYLMKKGGKTFPDLTGDGKVTFADILKGRKVKLKKKSQAYGGKVMQDGGETPGLDVKTRKTQVGFDVERQEPIMDDASQIYIEGLPVSAKEALAFMKERAEGMEGQISSSLGDAIEAAIMRRMSEMKGGREYMGPGIYRPTAEQELDSDQRSAGAEALMKRLGSYSSRGKRDF